MGPFESNSASFVLGENFWYSYHMKQSLVHVALLVRDYDEAIEFYTKKLHFTVVEDTKPGQMMLDSGGQDLPE
jgi:catechol-2,3-dioxygenase